MKLEPWILPIILTSIFILAAVGLTLERMP